MPRPLHLTLAMLPLAAIAASAQAPAVHLIAAPDAQTKPIFGTVPAVRQLPGGQLLVNDTQKRQLTLLDASLGNPSVIADSVPGMSSSYGTRGGGLIPYLADSSLFVDPAGLSMFVIDPAGKIARVASVPRSQDATFIGSNVLGNPGLDAKGRLVYRGGISIVRQTGGARGGGGGGGGGGAAGLPFALPDTPDSSAIVRVDLATRKLDTAGFFKIPKTTLKAEQTERGVTMTSEINPMPLVDEWTVLADGSIAIVRGQDYHVDFIDADGGRVSGAKIPFDWQRLDDDAKVAVIDSARKAMEAARVAAANAPPGSAPAGIAGDGAPRMMISFSTGGGTDGGGGMAQRIMAGGAPGMANASLNFISPSELPDYRPAFSAGAVKADADGNLWVRTSAVRAGAAGPIYDVIDRRGELIDRIQLPAARQIVGFGKGGVVYMTARDASGSWLERTHR